MPTRMRIWCHQAEKLQQIKMSWPRKFKPTVRQEDISYLALSSQSSQLPSAKLTPPSGASTAPRQNHWIEAARNQGLFVVFPSSANWKLPWTIWSVLQKRFSYAKGPSGSFHNDGNPNHPKIVALRNPQTSQSRRSVVFTTLHKNGPPKKLRPKPSPLQTKDPKDPLIWWCALPIACY